MKSAASNQTTKAPRSWSQALQYARFRALGRTQVQAAKEAGISERTAVTWEASAWWEECRREGLKAITTDMEQAARDTILAAIRNGDAQTARWLLERTDSTFAPPKQRQSLELSTSLGDVDFDALTDEQLAAIEAGEVPDGLGG